MERAAPLAMRQVEDYEVRYLVLPLLLGTCGLKT